MKRRLHALLGRGTKSRGLDRPPLERPAYAGRHSGRTALVLGNGPSLAEHAEALERLIADTEAVVLGANHVTPFRHPDYHAFTNRKRFFDYASTVDASRSRLLVGAGFEEEFVRAHFDGPFERIMYVDDHEAPFDVRDGVIQASCRTVSALLIGVAAVMGAERILVAGLDGFADTGSRPHYHAETRPLKLDPATLADVGRVTARYLDEIQDYLVRHGRRRFAIVTPTAYAAHHDSAVLAGARR